ncbi:unnamed protein product [Arctia plantaginis]|uniref:Uncharacterized protein n=1 Tax=Arctia plantaginis TaxID=874455 RepID=A0A8S1AUE5_ARCPL|nr:unnamed protein product [Arctia plantaginis]
MSLRSDSYPGGAGGVCREHGSPPAGWVHSSYPALPSPSIQALSEADRKAYDNIIKCMENLAAYLKFCGNVSNTVVGSRLSRPMQRKLVMLLQCAITDEEGRGKAARGSQVARRKNRD